MLAWMRSTSASALSPKTSANVLLRMNGRTRQVNPPGTSAQTGGISGHTLVLQIVRSGRSRLARFDVRTRSLTYLPDFVNDGAWLWRPDVDGSRVLYGAIVPGKFAAIAYEVRLADLRTRRVRVLARLDGHAEYAAPGQLRGSWATWVACPESSCNVWRQEVDSGAAESAPDPDHLLYTQIAAAVDRHGIVYFERLVATCGHPQIRRWDGGNQTTLIARLPEKVAYQYGYVTRDGRRLYFDAGACTRTARDDIYSLELGSPP